MSPVLYVNHKEFSDLWEWSMSLHESEFLTKVYQRWSWLRDLPFGTKVEVKVGEPK